MDSSKRWLIGGVAALLCSGVAAADPHWGGEWSDEGNEATFVSAEALAASPQQLQAGETVVAISAASLAPSTDDSDFSVFNIADRICTSGTCAFHGVVPLPHGALLERVQLDACDSTADVILVQLRFCPSAGDCTLMHSFNTGGTPGCGTFSGALLAHVVDALDGSYHLRLSFNGAGTELRARAVRFLYRSPDLPFGDGFERSDPLAWSGCTGCG